MVINFNPGEGGKEQEKKNLTYINSYANDIVNPCNVLCKTCQWHWNNRAIPIFQALKAIGSIKGNVWLYNHLSIEMIPWHTKTVGIKSYLLYVKDNVQRIFDYVIKFAANESRRIANDTLKNVVILKMSGGMTINILNIFTNAGINNKVIIPPTPPLPNGGRYMVFSFDDIQGVKFVSIWGQRSRNNFPPQDDLKEILKTIQCI